jgi:hypothetical protein
MHTCVEQFFQSQSETELKYTFSIIWEEMG